MFNFNNSVNEEKKYIRSVKRATGVSLFFCAFRDKILLIFRINLLNLVAKAAFFIKYIY